jgi:hypothetical protein
MAVHEQEQPVALPPQLVHSPHYAALTDTLTLMPGDRRAANTASCCDGATYTDTQGDNIMSSSDRSDWAADQVPSTVKI